MLFTANHAIRASCLVGEILEAYCERAAVVGSLRRGKVRVHDVDLLVISKVMEVPAAEPSLFKKTETVPAVHLRLKEMAACRTIVDLHLGPKICRFGFPVEQIIIPFDLYLADETTWPTLLLIRTGSKQNNIRLCQRAQKLDLKLHADGSGLSTPADRFLKVESEEDIYRLLRLPYQQPERRG